MATQSAIIFKANLFKLRYDLRIWLPILCSISRKLLIVHRKYFSQNIDTRFSILFKEFNQYDVLSVYRPRIVPIFIITYEMSNKKNSDPAFSRNQWIVLRILFKSWLTLNFEHFRYCMKSEVPKRRADKNSSVRDGFRRLKSISDTIFTVCVNRQVTRTFQNARCISMANFVRMLFNKGIHLTIDYFTLLLRS